MAARQETETRRRPRTVEFKDLDPERISKTLGWDSKSFPDKDGTIHWYFYGPICLEVSRRIYPERTFGSAEVYRIDKRSSIATASIYAIEEVTFNKSAQEITLRAGNDHLTIKSTGQVDGSAMLHFRAPLTR